MTFEECKTWLLDDGWRLSKSNAFFDTCDFLFYKGFRGIQPNCYCNPDKESQICIKVYDHRKHNSGVGFQIELRAEPKDGVWVILECYSLSLDNIKDQLPKQINKLARAWRAINEE